MVYERKGSDVADRNGKNGSHQVVLAEPARRDALASLMAASFDQDPVSAWLFPDAESRAAVQSRFFAVFLDMVFSFGEVHTMSTGNCVALWLPVEPTQQEDVETRAAFDE